jgi:DNA-binding transcriptional ArsR family regulator
MSTATGERVKGLATGAPATVAVDLGSAYELVLGLRMLVDREDATSYGEGPPWFDHVRTATPATVLAAIERYSGGHEITFGYLLALVPETPSPRDAESFVSVLEQVPPLELRQLLLGGRLLTYRGGVGQRTIAAAASGERRAVDELLAGCLDWQRAPYEHVLSLDPGEAKRLLLQVCTGWHEAVLGPVEQATTRALRRSARAAKALAKRLPPEDLVDTLTRGVRYVPETGIDRILLVPHVVSRPWAIFTEAGSTKIVCYAVAEEYVSGDEPPDPLVAAYKALGDETRLRILRRLSQGPATLQELTELTGLAKSTVHGHLLVLRTGGLVVTDLSKKAGYALRRETLAHSAALLESYLEGAEA